jgi:hypothetical protein
VTIAKRPSFRVRDGRDKRLIWGNREAKYFCERDWTDEISLESFDNFSFTRNPNARGGAPDRKTQKMPLRTRRSFASGTPRGFIGQPRLDGSPFVVGEFVGQGLESRPGSQAQRGSDRRRFGRDAPESGLVMLTSVFVGHELLPAP